MPLPLAPRLVHLRLLRIHNRASHHLAGVFQITIYLLRPQQHELGGVIEVIRLLRIFGQIIRQLQPKADQIANGVLVLEVGQPPRLRGYRRFPAFRHRLSQTRLNPLCHRTYLRRVRPFCLLLGRHLAALQHLQNQLPTLQRFPRRQTAVHIMQRHLPLLLLRPMTLHAMRLEKGRDDSIKFLGRQRRRGTEPQQQTAAKIPHRNNPFHRADSLACLRTKSTKAWL